MVINQESAASSLALDARMRGGGSNSDGQLADMGAAAGWLEDATAPNSLPAWLAQTLISQGWAPPSGMVEKTPTVETRRKSAAGSLISSVMRRLSLSSSTQPSAQSATEATDTSKPVSLLERARRRVSISGAAPTRIGQPSHGSLLEDQPSPVDQSPRGNPSASGANLSLALGQFAIPDQLQPAALRDMDHARRMSFMQKQDSGLNFLGVLPTAKGGGSFLPTRDRTDHHVTKKSHRISHIFRTCHAHARDHPVSVHGWNAIYEREKHVGRQTKSGLFQKFGGCN